METNLQQTSNWLTQLSAVAVAKDSRVQAKFTEVYGFAHSKERAEEACATEAIAFAKAVQESEQLRKATPLSLFYAFIDLAVTGLSLNPKGGKPTCYLLARNTKTPQGSYETRAYISVTGYGEIQMRINAGQIRGVDNPVIVYEDDEFTYSQHDGHKDISYTCHLPHKGQKIAAFARIIRADGTTDYAVMLREDWVRLEGYSAKSNGKYDRDARQFVPGRANELYGADGDIDTGFLIAKLLKHAFSTYPKLRMGAFTSLETQETDELPADIYSLPADSAQPAQPEPASQPQPAASSGDSDFDGFLVSDDGAF